VWVGGLVGLAAIGWGVIAWSVANGPGLLGRRPSAAWGALPRAVVRRADVDVSLTAGGRVESAVKTLIECELESLHISTEGRSATVGGSAAILELVADGADVHEGDVLCRFDASEYEEMVRQQEIKVEQARADRRRAELDVQSAATALREYQDGLRMQRRKEFQGQIALAEADLRRQQDRLAWAQRMLPMGYIAASNLQNERLQRLRAEVTLDGLRDQFKNFLRFVEPNTLRTLGARVASSRTTLEYQTARLARQENQLAHFRHQVELCTIRAPHDGLAIYANEQDSDARIEPGVRVRQKQDLFYLPDLSRMEVQTLLHETVVERVRAGMPARVRIEALAEQVVPGRVVAISPMPMPRRKRSAPDIKNYMARVALGAIPAGLRPGMSAAVEILTDCRTGALVVPGAAVAIEGGRDVCYVAGPRGLERRRVAVAPASRDLLEVTEGLAEGEEVVLDPARAEVAAAFEAPTTPGEGSVTEADVR
jgi:HlyD family secretion protein